jgi:arabinofuranosyltransferase
MLRTFYLLFAAFACSLMYWGLYNYTTIGIDDAQIYFVYFRNFAQGHGFVYNFGSERVEGFTSLLWTLIGSGAYLLSPAHFPQLLLVLNGLLLFGILYLFDKGMRMMASPHWALIALGCLIGYIVLTPGYLDWIVVSLMETGLWSFLLTAAVVTVMKVQFAQRYTYLLSVLVLLLVITRPESMLWCIFFIFMVILTISLQTRKINFRPATVMAGTFTLSLVALLVFRLSYFGYPLPNTYYAKMSGNLFYNLFEGGRYLFLSMVQLPILWFFLLLSLLSLLLIAKKVWDRRREENPIGPAYRFQLILAASAFLSFMIPLYTGGDHFGMARMLQPLVPVYFLMAFNIPFWQEASGIALRKTSPVGIGISMLAVFPMFYFSAEVPLHRVVKDQTPISGEIYVARTGMEDAEKLNQLFEPLAQKPTVGVSAAGGFAWVYQGPTFDLLGLNHTAMAHATGSREGVKNHASFDVYTLLELKPPVFHGYSHGSAVIARFHEREADAFHPLTQEGFQERFVNEIFKGVFFEPLFVQTYRPAVIQHPNVPGIVYQAYFLKEYLKELQGAGYLVRELSLQDVRKGFDPDQI